MIKFFCFLLIFCASKIPADEPSYFSPWLYQSLWPDFCLDHLTSYPNECSQNSIDTHGNFYLTYLADSSANTYVDQEIINRLAGYITFIPTNSQFCDFRFCPNCQSPVIRDVITEWDDADDDDEDWSYSYLCYKCRCLKSCCDIRLTNLGKETLDVINMWKRCNEPAIPYGYFDIHNKQYLPFLEQLFQLTQENPPCLCYWPHRSELACQISDFVYEEMQSLIEIAPINKLTGNDTPSPTFPYLINRSDHGLLNGLFIHSFFYTHYRQVLLDLASWTESNCTGWCLSFWEDTTWHLNTIYAILDRLQPQFLTLYSNCLKMHPHPKIYYERGMILFHQGKTIEALDDMHNCIKALEKNPQEELLSSELYLQEGTYYAELGAYDKAIEALSKAISKDPSNKEAYFERAQAYFETGNFEESFSDFINSNQKSHPLDISNKINFDYASGLILGTAQGAAQGFLEYVPNLIGSFHGLGQGLWAFLANPTQISQELVQACRDCTLFIRTHSSAEIIQELVPELKTLVQDWNNLTEYDRGRLMGVVIGKYGVEIFAGASLAKGVTAYRTLKRANNLLTYELATLNQQNRAYLAARALERAENRKRVLRQANLNIQWSKQNKHILKYMKPDDKRSILTHPDPQKLVNEFAGSGCKINPEMPGTPGYRERIDFGEKIGIWKSSDGVVAKETTVGMIIYANDGVHLIPLRPIE